MWDGIEDEMAHKNMKEGEKNQREEKLEGEKIFFWLSVNNYHIQFFGTVTKLPTITLISAVMCVCPSKNIKKGTYKAILSN